MLAATPSSEFKRPERDRVLGSSATGTVGIAAAVVVAAAAVGMPVDLASREVDLVNAASRSGSDMYDGWSEEDACDQVGA